MSNVQKPSSTTSSLIKLLQRKRYQYEVTYSLYMLTPMEKFIFSMLLSFPLYPLRAKYYVSRVANSTAT